MTILRCVTTLFYGLLLTQAAISAKPKVGAKKAAKPMALTSAAPRVPSAVLPHGTGPLTAAQLSTLNFKSAGPPEIVEQLKMPAVNVVPGQRPDLRALARSEIRTSGIAQKVAQAKGLKGADASPEKVAELIERGLHGALNQEDASGIAAAHPGGRRLMGLWDDIVGFFEDVGCGAFATGALPGYLAAYAIFHACNSGYVGLTPHQKYFQRSVFGFEILNKVNVKYGACFPVGFENAAATTMGTEIYVRAPAATTDVALTSNMALSAGFKSQLLLLLHELGHSKQYYDRSWSVSAFGWKYLEQYCKAGFSYSKNSMEVEATTYPPKVATIIIDPAVAHFKKWRKDGLNVALTFSKSAKEYTNLNLAGKAIMSLDLTKTGAVKDGESQRKAGTRCVRILRGAELASRAVPDIATKPWDCVDVVTKAPTKKPTTRKPSSPPSWGIIVQGPIEIAPTPKPKAPTTIRPGGGGITLATAKPTPMAPTWAIPKATAGGGTLARARAGTTDGGDK